MGVYCEAMRAWLAASVVLVACGGQGPGGTADGSAVGDGNGSGDGSSNVGWDLLISRTWTLAPGTEAYKCSRIRVPTDMWVNGFRAMSPIGTHHEVLTVSTSTSTGDYDCSAAQVLTEMRMMYAAGVNTDDLVFPTGVAVHLAAGTYININLHLFNLSDVDINGSSGVLVKTVPAATVVNEADMMFAGTQTIAIPSDNTAHTAQGGCSAPVDWHVFALWPHMHQVATHQKFVFTHAATPMTLLDTGYAFAEQKNYPMAETIIHAGDQVQVTCTYVNNTGATIYFGDSSTDEMCFTGMYKYPAGGGLFGCTS
jgi:hypothetical protein